MASLSKQKTKTGVAWRIQFNGDGKRKSVFLGKMPKKTAETIFSKVEQIIACKASGMPFSVDVATWIGEIDIKLHEKLSCIGLVPVRLKATLKEFCDTYCENRKAKDSTKEVWRQATHSLIEYSGGNYNPSSITTDQAQRFAEVLAENGLAPSTMDKRFRVIRQIYNEMIRQKMVYANPFREVKTKATIDQSRNVYVERDLVEQIIDTIPDPEWRLIIGLSRYCGLRAPSEVLSLTWDCVLWDKQRIVVKSPKTEQHEGKDSRVIPMFEGIRPLLEAVFEQAEPGGSPYVIARNRSQADSVRGWRNTNLGSVFKKHILRAGEQPWPKLFHGMRASSETDLVNSRKYAFHVIAYWLGHSVKIALTHYTRVRDEDFNLAIESEVPSTMKNGEINVTNLEQTEGQSLGCVQNHVQHTPEIKCRRMQEGSITSEKTTVCNTIQSMVNLRMGDTGLEPVTFWV